jgi:hypothetical protein
VNPVDWLGWVYGRFFAGHPYVFNLVSFVLAGLVGLLLSMRVVDKFRQEHPSKPRSETISVQAPPEAPKKPATNLPEKPAEPRRHPNIQVRQKTEGQSITIEQRTEGPSSPIVNSPITVNPERNPYAPVIIYDFQGNKKVITEGGTNVHLTVGDQRASFDRMVELQNSHDWSGLRDFCENQMRQTPEWLTPALFAGIAYANLGDKKKAIELLSGVQGKSAGDASYQDATRILKLLRDAP